MQRYPHASALRSAASAEQTRASLRSPPQRASSPELATGPLLLAVTVVVIAPEQRLVYGPYGLPLPRVRLSATRQKAGPLSPSSMPYSWPPSGGAGVIRGSVVLLLAAGERDDAHDGRRRGLTDERRRDLQRPAAESEAAAVLLLRRILRLPSRRRKVANSHGFAAGCGETATESRKDVQPWPRTCETFLRTDTDGV